MLGNKITHEQKHNNCLKHKPSDNKKACYFSNRQFPNVDNPIKKPQKFLLLSENRQLIIVSN